MVLSAGQLGDRYGRISLSAQRNGAHPYEFFEFSIDAYNMKASLIAGNSLGNGVLEVEGDLDVIVKYGYGYGNISSDGFITSGKTTSVKVRRTSDQATANNTWAVIAFNAEFWDERPTGISEQHSTSSNTTRLTCRVAGKYLVFGEAIFASNTSGNRSLTIRKNGAALGDWEATVAQVPNVGGWATDMQISTVLDLAVGDYVELCALQSSGGNLNILYRYPESPVFGMIKIA
jgi:hypothetical protein